MIGLKQVAGVLASLIVMVSGAVLQTGDDTGAVALQTLESGGAELVAQTPQPVSIPSLHAFELSTSDRPATAPALLEGAIEEVRLVSSTVHPPVTVELGDQTLRIQPGSRVTITGYEGALSLGEAQLTTVVTGTGTAREIEVHPPMGRAISTQANGPAGIPAVDVSVDGQPITHSYRSSGTFQTINATLLASEPEGGALPSLIAGNEALPTRQNVSFQLWDYVGVVVTVALEGEEVLLRLDGFANITVEGETLFRHEVHEEERLGISGITPGNKAPTANFTWRPGTPQVGQEVEFVDRSDDDLFIYSWTWRFGDGSAPVHQQHPTHVYQNPGTYTVNLTVTDAQGKSSTELRPIVVDIKRPEIGFSWSPLKPLEGQTVNFTAHGMDARGDPIDQFQWHLPGGIVTTGRSVEHTFQQQGAYEIGLKGTDADGVTAWRNRTLTVGNAPPIANFTVTPETPMAGDPATLQSTSTDRGNGSVVNHTWQVRDLAGTFYGETVTLSFPRDGPVPVRLTVTDDQGKSTTITKDVQVLNPPPTVSISQSPVYPNPDETVTFVAHVEDDDPLPASAVWDFSNGVSRTGLAVSLRFPDPGPQTVELLVTDPDGATGTASRSFTVNSPPIATINRSAAVVHTGEPVTFTGNVIDPDGNATTLTWFVDGSDAGTGETLVRSWADNGNHSIRLTAKDDNGAVTRTSTSVLVLNRPPTLSPSAESSMTNLGSPVVLSANAQDPDGTISNVAWRMDGETVGTGQQISIAFDTPGVKTLNVTATDDDGATETAQLNVTVNSPPTLQASVSDTTIDAGQEITFDATASDPDGDNVSVVWDLGDGSPLISGTSSFTHAYDVAGQYRVTVTATDEHGATTTRVFNLQITTPDLDTSLTVSPGTPQAGETVQFSISVPAGRQVEGIDWTFGDGTTVTTGAGVTSVTHTYTRSDRVFMTARVAADHGSVDTNTRNLRITGAADHEIRFRPVLPDGQCVNLTHPEAHFNITNLFTGTLVTYDQGAPTWTTEGSCTLSYTFAAGSWAVGDGLFLEARVGQALLFDDFDFNRDHLLQRVDYVLAHADLVLEDAQVEARENDAKVGSNAESTATFHDPTEEVWVSGNVTWAEGTPVNKWRVDLAVTYRGPLPTDPLESTYATWTEDTDSGGQLRALVPMPLVNADGEIVGAEDSIGADVAFLPGQYSVNIAATSSSSSGTEGDSATVLFIEDPEGIFQMFADAGIPV